MSRSALARRLCATRPLQTDAPPATTMTHRHSAASGHWLHCIKLGGIGRHAQPIARWAWLVLGLCSALGAAHAQPVAGAAVTPPARVDTALRGSVLATVRVSGPAACLAECQRIAGCTGYNFSGGGPGPVLPGSPGGRLGAGVEGRAPNCTLMAGTLADVAGPGVVSCRVPCTAATGAIRPTVREPGVATLRPPGASTLPGTALTPPPVRQAAGSSASAPTRTPVLVTPPLVIGGIYTPPPAPAPAPRPVATPATPAAPAARSGVSGYEVVTGPWVDIAPLSHAVTAAQCPAGKFALSAGYRVQPASGHPQFGLEVRGAMPDGREARVWVRNANVVDAAQAQAVAVCIASVPGLRVLDTTINAQGSGGPSSGQLQCAPHERPIGGGLMGGNDTLMSTNAPQASPAAGTGWQGAVTKSSPLPGRANPALRLLCAPEAAVDGWERVESADVTLGARSRAEPALGCPGGKALLAAGVSQLSNNLLDMVVASLAPRANTPDWAAQVANRNTIGGSGAVVARLSALCARRQ